MSGDHDKYHMKVEVVKPKVPGTIKNMTHEELKIELVMLKAFIAGLDHVSYCRVGVKHIVTEIRQKAKDLRPVREEEKK